jgi:hypothetical protein
MRNTRFLIALGLSLSFAGYAHAACSVGVDCITPGLGGVTANTITTISANARNSSTAVPNDPNSIFYFEATTAGSPSTTPDSANGTVVIVGLQYFGGGNPNDTIAGLIQPVVGGTAYNIFVRACPPGQPVTHGNCSAWVSLGSRTTTAYPANPGFPNVVAADTLPQAFTARTSGVQDSANVLAWQITVNNNDAQLPAGSSSLLTQQPFSGAGTGAGSFAIDTGDYAGLLPNVRYNLTERLIYFYNKPGPNLTTGNFFTQAVDPVADSVTNITHCSATLNYHNAAANPANPEDTTYSVNVGGPVASGSAVQTNVIGGTGIFSDNDSVTYTNLQAGTTYSATVTALNRGGSPWRNSNADGFNQFTTVAWGGTFSVPAPSIATTSADFVASGVNTAGVQSWQIQTTPAVAGLPSGTPGDLNGTHTMTGLTPNTQYTVQIRITEASGCFSVLPISAIPFTTTPNTPQTFNLTAPAARQLSASWATNGNPSGTIYQVQYCEDAGFSVNCRTQNSAAGASSIASITTGVLPQTTYHARVRANTIGGGLNSPYSNSDSATTPNEAPTINTASCSSPTGSPSQSTCGGTVTDNGAVSELRCSWSATGGAGTVTFTPLTPQTATGSSMPATCPNVTATFPGNGTYTVTLTVTDANGSGLTDTQNVSVSVGATPTSITVAPSASTIATGNTQQFTATVRDQFNNVIPGQTVNWSVSGGGTIPGGASATKTFTATTPGGPFTLTASLSGASNGTAQITVVAAGPFFATPPTLTVNPNNLTGTLTALGDDNVFGESSLTYTWTLESGPAAISVSPNGTNAAKNATVTFSRAGTYVLRCTIANTISAFATTNPGNVAQVLTSIGVTPNNVTISVIDSQTFTATGLDQFGEAMNLTSVTWTSTGGNISGAGTFQSGTLGNNIRVTATSGAIAGSANVNVVNYDVSGAVAYPVPFKSTQGSTIHFRGLGSSAKIRIYTVSGREVFSTEVGADTYDWDVKNKSGESIASGVYLYVIESPSTTKHGKLIIIQ